LWAGSAGAEIVARLPTDPAAWLPAARDLLVTMMAVEAEAPATGGDLLLLGRIDTLLRLGDLGRAARLMEAAGVTEPEIFRRWFDTELLTNNGNRACSRLRALPDVSPTYSARIFCLARGGDWPAAALTLETAETLDVVTKDEADLLARFLDTEMFEGEPPLPLPDRPTPLSYAMYEAIGQAIPTATLPIAFAHADLRPVAGWKARLDAAERLARAGALPPAQLFDIYAERRAAASGGVWERVDAVRALERRLAEDAPGDITAELTRAWAEMTEAGLAVPFARAFAGPLLALPAEAAPQALVAEVALLGPDPAAAADRLPGDARGRLLAALARGDSPPGDQDGLHEALARGFSEGPDDAAPQSAAGAEILRLLQQVEAGRQGNHGALAEGLAGLRHLGLEGWARRIALQVALLEVRT
jgi:hypothetical protein